VGLAVWDEERAVLKLVAGSFGASEHVTACHVIDMANRRNVAVVFGLMQASVNRRPVSDHPILDQYAEAFGIEHLISTGLGTHVSPTGILHVARDGRPFSAGDVDRCNAIATRVTRAVDSTRILTGLSLQRQLEAALSRQAVAIASGRGGDGLREALDALRELLRASMIALIPTHAAPLITASPALPLAVERQLIEGARSERTESVAFQAPSRTGDPGSATLCIPVHLGTEHLGTLVTFRNRYESFTVEERHGLARMAELVALSWASERYQQHRAVLARLEERQRIADDLHDDVVQMLFAAQMHLDGILAQNVIPEDARARATMVRGLLSRGETTIRDVIMKLSRPLPTGLPERLYEVADGIDEDFMLPVHVEISDTAAHASRHARRAVADTIVKVAHEALVNAAKHAGPCRVNVTLELASPDRILLRVADNGAGGPARQSSESHGLTSLRRHVRRHGGTLRVTRGQTGGTVVTAGLPL
jgi:signal transduction histidine kinase